MKLFHFYRNEDFSGVSGTGPVVEGVQFTNGWCALRWISSKSSICFYQSLEEVKAIHSHGGRTEIIVHDFEPLKRRETPAVNARFEVLMQIIEDASRITNLAEEPGVSAEEISEAIDELRTQIDRLERTILRRKGLKRPA